MPLIPRTRDKLPVSAEPWKPTAEQIAAAGGKKVPDCLAADLRVLLVGINPSLYSAAVGHHFARPGNRFWPTLHRAGITPRLFSPFEDQQLVEVGYGITNIVARATARADELTTEELKRGARTLARKIRRWKPRCAAFVGITAYRAAFARPRAQMGRQSEQLAGAMVWLLPNSSGLNAHYQLADFARHFAELHRAN
jgi:TDG/mug DNA glycosylase family protein